MTKKQCLEMTAALWDWLAENPDKGKHDWPGWADSGFADADPCRQHNSPYIRWVSHLSTRQQRTDAAREIAALARSQL
jgi:hypothetical protein